MLQVELGLRGQDYPPKELLDFRYREHFGMSQEELENEPEDVYNLNLAIIGKINSLAEEEQRHRANSKDRESRME